MGGVFVSGVDDGHAAPGADPGLRTDSHPALALKRHVRRLSGPCCGSCASPSDPIRPSAVGGPGLEAPRALSASPK